MITAAIIDDEQHSIDTLKWKLENYCPDVHVVASFDQPQKGIRFLRENPIDLLFLDIEMPLLNGFDVLEEDKRAGLFTETRTKQGAERSSAEVQR
jgi:two-component system LytT family response regulator